MASIESCPHAMDGASRTPQPITQTSIFALLSCANTGGGSTVSTDITMKREATTEFKTHCSVEMKADIQSAYQVEAADALSMHILSSWHTGQASSMMLSAGSRTTMDGIFERLLSEMRTAHKNDPQTKGVREFQLSSHASGIAWKFFFHDLLRLADVNPSRMVLTVNPSTCR